MKNTSIKHDEVYQYEPLTENQKKAFDVSLFKQKTPTPKNKVLQNRI